MTTTRSVCKGWKAGSEGVINKLKIPYNSPVPASFFTLGDRFPELTHLDLGESRTTVDKLNQLQGIKKLTNLKLGARKSPGLYFQTGFPKVIESKPPEFPKECMALSLQYDKLDDVRRIRTIQVSQIPATTLSSCLERAFAKANFALSCLTFEIYVGPAAALICVWHAP